MNYGTVSISPMRGGTFITNFGEEERPAYEEALRRHGDPQLVIRGPSASWPFEGGGSLHDLAARRRELGSFWRVFDAVKAERAA